MSVSLLPLLLKTAGFRRSGEKRRSCRSRRWSKSAQAVFTSWAVLGQLGGMALLVADGADPNPAKASILNIPIISILDTNCDPDLVDIPIPGNDDSTLSIQLILNKLAESIYSAQTKK